MTPTMDSATAVTAVTALYLIVPVIVLLAYVPQIARLVRDPASGAAHSLATWVMWTVAGAVTLLYVAVKVHDPLLVITAAGNLVGECIVLVYAVLARIRRTQRDE